MGAVVIRRAGSHEGDLLREIAIAAKGYWEYEEDLVRSWGGASTSQRTAFAGRRCTSRRWADASSAGPG